MAKTKKELDKEKRAAEQAKAKADREAKAKARAEERAKEKAAIEAEKTRYKSLSPEEKKAEDKKRASEAEKKQIEEIKAKVQKRYDLSKDEERLLRRSQLLENPLSYDENKDRISKIFKDSNERLEFSKKYQDLKEKDIAERKKTDPYLMMDKLFTKEGKDFYKKILADYGGKLDQKELNAIYRYDDSLATVRRQAEIPKHRYTPEWQEKLTAQTLRDNELAIERELDDQLKYLANLRREKEQKKYWQNFDREHNTALYLNELADIDDLIANPDQYRNSYAYAQDYDVDLKNAIARRAEIQRELGSLGYRGPERTSAMPNYAPVALAAEPVVAAPVTQPSSMTTAKTEPQGLPKVLEMKEAAAQPVYELPQEPIAVAQPQQPAPQPTGLASLPPQRMSQADIDAYAKTYNAYTPNTQISTGTYDPALEQKLGMTLNQVLQPNTTTTMKRGGYVKPKVPVKKKSGYVSKNQSKTASRRGDGIAQRGKTRGRMV